MEWKAERKAVKEKRKKHKVDKKQEEREEIVQLLQDQKKHKKKSSTKKEHIPTPTDIQEDNENGIKSILKRIKDPKKRSSVTFSPQLEHVKPIPRVKSAPIQTRRIIIPSPQTRNQKRNRKSKLLRKRR